MSNSNWQGVFPAVTTQFREDQSLDLPATERHLAALVEAGVDGLIVCGSLGENQALERAEKLQLIEIARAVADQRIPVLCGVAENTAAAARQFIAAAERAGADGFMILPALGYRADRSEALRHFRRVAAATALPWMLYNNPLSYPVDIGPNELTELATLDNLVAVKESSGDPRRITQLRIALGDRFRLFIGVDDLALEAAALGTDGWVAGSGIAMPRENQHFWNLLRQGRWDEARAFYRWFFPLLQLDTHPKFVQYIKLAVQEAGLGAEWVREPRQTLEGAERAEILAVIRRVLGHRFPAAAAD